MSFGKVFKKIAGAKPTSNYGQRPPVGTHGLLLKSWEIKETRDDSEVGDYFVASSYLVEDSTDPKLKKDTAVEWPWFVDAPGWQGKYALANAQMLSKAILDSFDFACMPRDANGCIISPITGQPYLIEDEDDPRRGQPKTEHDIATVSELCEQGFFRGIKIICKVEPSFNKKTKKPNINPQTGEQYTDAIWKASPGQTIESLLAARAHVDKIDPPEKKDEKPAQTATTPPTPTQNVGGYAVPAQPGPQMSAAQTHAYLSAPVQPAATAPAPAATATAPSSAPVAGGLAAMMAQLKKGS